MQPDPDEPKPTDPVDIPLTPDDRDPVLQRLLQATFEMTVDVETAARHLWVLHRIAGTATVKAPARPAARKTVVALLVGIMTLGSSSAAVAASRETVPGDMLYGVKRGVERVQLALTSSPQGEAELRIEFASRRFEEAVVIAPEAPALVANLIREALADVTRAEQTGDVAVQADAQDIRQDIASLPVPAPVVQAEPTIGPVPSASSSPAPSEDAIVLELPTLLPELPAPSISPLPSLFPSPSITPAQTVSPTLTAPGQVETATVGAATASPSPSPTPSPSPSQTDDRSSGGDERAAEQGPKGDRTPTPSPSRSPSPAPSPGPSGESPPAKPRPLVDLNPTLG